MFTMLAVVAYLTAFVIAVFLLYHFGSAHFSWHLLSIVAALALGMMPAPGPIRPGPGVDLVFGFAFIFLMTWGIGGLLVFRRHPHREKHA